jgi:hypothetical protein
VREFERAHIDDSDLLIVGPFPSSRTPLVAACKSLIYRILKKRRLRPLTVFHTGENVRYDAKRADYSISFDVDVGQEHHLRWPLWKELLDWSDEELAPSTFDNPRFGSLLSIHKLVRPLGSAFLRKPRRAAFFASHVREPRPQLIDAVSTVMPVDLFGPAFESHVKDHNTSGRAKRDTLEAFGFSLCPENSLYPGYHTEKIPEAFCADTLPITWVSESARMDFNPGAFLNLAAVEKDSLPEYVRANLTDQAMARFAEQPLLTERPSLGPLREFARRILTNL